MPTMFLCFLLSGVLATGSQDLSSSVECGVWHWPHKKCQPGSTEVIDLTHSLTWSDGCATSSVGGTPRACGTGHDQAVCSAGCERLNRAGCCYYRAWSHLCKFHVGIFGVTYTGNSDVVAKICGSEPPVAAAGLGDPHYVSHDGLRYTFNGVGEYVFTEAASHGFRLHVRTWPVGNGTAAFEGIAVQFQDKNLNILWRGDDASRVAFYVDGEMEDPDQMPLSSGVTITHVRLADSGRYNVKWVQVPGLELVINYRHRSSFKLRIPRDWFGQVRGLAGNFNGIVDDDLSDNGSGIASTSTMETIHRFAEKTWRVPDHASLFLDGDNPTGAKSVVTTQPTFANEEFETRARQVCGTDQFCLFDAAATNNLEYARWTLYDMSN